MSTSTLNVVEAQIPNVNVEELTTGRRFICPITAVLDGVAHPIVRDTFPFIAAELVWRACATRCSTETQIHTIDLFNIYPCRALLNPPRK